MNETEGRKFATLRERIAIRNQLRNRKTILVILLSIIVILIFIFSMLSLSYREKQSLFLMKSTAANQKDTLTQVIQMKNQLTEIRRKEANLPSEQDINRVNQEMAMMKSSLTRWHDQILNDIANLLATNNQSLTDKITQLQMSLKQIPKNQIMTWTLLRSSALPFKVTNIDIWNGQPMATVTLEGYSDLMAKGDTRQGWTLVDLSFDPASAIFQSHNHQRVKLSF